MNGNYVSIVGYQFERIHTGVICWILDTKNKLVSFDVKVEALRRIYRMCGKQLPFSQDELVSIVCKPEYSFGRKRKIDLVIEIELAHQTTKYLVIEMKVDSIPYSGQLEGSVNDFFQKKRCDPDDALFLLFLFGTSQVCEEPSLHSFTAFRLPEILEVFSGLSIQHYIYDHWIDALQEELNCLLNISQALEQAPDIWDEAYWKELGYRPMFPLFYYIYHDLKNASTRHKEWTIYSGGNNPVMNWKNGSLDKVLFGYPVKFYWEFNYQEFVLKVQLSSEKQLPKNDLIWLRDEIASTCSSDIEHPGKRTRNSYGTFNSLYKWAFDFQDQDFKEIMTDVDGIIDTIHPLLKKL